MLKLVLLLLTSATLMAQKFSSQEISRWEAQAKQVAITRDAWGVPHISGKTDADAVFGILYAQCEDDFPRVERNYLIATARMAEAEGEAFIYHDLRMRLFMDTTTAIAVYASSPESMKKLCQAFADGINYYLHTHPETKPKLLKRFQPWMPLLFSEGSIGGDIESVSLNGLKAFYGKSPGTLKEEANDDGLLLDPGGSNGFAIAPMRSANGNALFLINPHTSFYFRCELQMTSEEGLNSYGAVTWGQFFIYQGFNEHCGWMHTSSQADVIDEYKETILKKGGKVFYKYGSEQRPMASKKVSIRFKSAKGYARNEFTTYYTQHGPVTSEREGKWVTTRLMQEPLKALTQSFLRTKAVGLEEFKKTMDLQTNSSNNTVYADDKGNIAYWHGNFMPRRSTDFDWSKPVDGSDPRTEWQGLHPVDEIVQTINPADGWIQNCNSTPFTVSGASSPVASKYPGYMAPDAENARGIHAVRVLKDETSFTLEELIGAAYDPSLPAFEQLLPSLIKAYDGMAVKNDTLRANYGEAMQLLRNWDMKWTAQSIPTTLSIYWAQRLRQQVGSRVPPGTDQIGIIKFLETQTSDQEKLFAFAGVVAELRRDFGSWKQAWGAINRFQRITGTVEPAFDDAKPSIGVPFPSAFWGSLASYVSRRYPNTKKMYGSSGNSFVAAVEFGRKVRAKSVVTGGSSSSPESKHFNDQSPMYCQGQFKDVLFYKEDYLKNAERTYHPGEK